MMSVSCRNEDNARAEFQSCKSTDAKHRVQFYDSWAENYEKDASLMCYRAPHLAVDFLSSSFSGSRGAARVLDVACGSGLVAKLMLELGFKHFVGVDGSQGMLDQAAKTGIYEELRLALLGAEPLPAKIGAFDVVIMVGALDPGFAPVSVVRELCQAAKPGGLICMSRGDHRGPAGREYKKDLEAELQLMEEEDLWSPVGLKRTNRYMKDPHLKPEEIQQLQLEECYLSGTAYLYKKHSR
uniref:Methyltransferase type 11 domain-containing protein n=1 Tax=Gasterosteus aculeatus aculeatus TaxID=481459 RepID=A0AAQ4P5E5_GASAC|nr:methyltransferase-like protein 27 [Gasterosteus aculeatus aculeatus]